MRVIDGSQGEGGGQVLRTSLALSAVTGAPFRIERIRAGRAKPGLLRQHLTAARAVAEVCGARVEGDALGSTALTFAPGPVRPGRYRFAVGTAGSAGLVLQAVLPPLLVADGPSELWIEGGTHNPHAPPAGFLQRALLPLIGRMGPEVRLELVRPGFYPAGGGSYRVTVTPAPLRPLSLLERGPIASIEPTALVAHLPARVGHRELERIRSRLALERRAGRVADVAGPGPGNAVEIAVTAGELTEVFSGFGERGRPAEAVADEAVDALLRWRDAGVPVGEHLADQLLVPLALGGGGTFRTLPPSLHTTTNAAVIAAFLDVKIAIDAAPGAATITVRS